MTIERVLEILDDAICYERKKAEQASVEGEGQWALAHTYAELECGRIANKIRREEERDAT